MALDVNIIPWQGFESLAGHNSCRGIRRSREARGRLSTFRAWAAMLISLSRRADIGPEMPLRETEAIVLRTYRLAETDKIASLLTRHLGRIRAVASGAQRPKSRFGGALEPLSYVRVWVFERENRDLLRMSSAELLESFFDMQKDYRVHVAAQYLAEVSERFLPEREVNEAALRLLLKVLRALKHSGEINRPLAYFDYWLLRLGGFLPSLEKCESCGRLMGDGAGFYGPGSEGLLCASCRIGAAQQAVPAQALAAVGTACRLPLEQWLANQKAAPGCREVRLFFEELIESHLEKKLLTRPLLVEQV